jgi:hypothetical protein
MTASFRLTHPTSGSMLASRQPTRRSSFTLVLLLLAGVHSLACAQNVVSRTDNGSTAPPVQLDSNHAAELLAPPPARDRIEFREPEGRRVADQLDAHVRELIDGWPWMPFQHTHGISGYQTFFQHPELLFHALSGALPFLSTPTADRTRAFLRDLLPHYPPFAVAGWDRRAGQPRESYTVPPGLRLSGHGQARSAFGVHAFWTYCHFANDPAAARSHWPAIQRRIQPLLDAPYPFDIRRTDYSRDEAALLNGNLAGLIGFIQLARLLDQTDAELEALPRLTELLQHRVNLERVNPRLLDRSTATRSLHLFHLARYEQLTPEIAHAIRHWSHDLASPRLRAFRESRPAWWLAFGDRTVGGENYTNPPHFTHALFTAASLLEQASATTLFGWLDVPWCKADLYFIERCTLALRAATSAPVAHHHNPSPIP